MQICPATSDQGGGVGLKTCPPVRQLIHFRKLLADLANGAAGEGDAAASVLHVIAFDLRGGGEPDKFVIALGEGGEVEAERLDDAVVVAASALPLALLVIPDDKNTRLEQLAVERLHAGRRQIQKFLLPPCRGPRDGP